jgi:hypothetical protein
VGARPGWACPLHLQVRSVDQMLTITSERCAKEQVGWLGFK